jgi:hypothetical protein
MNSIAFCAVSVPAIVLKGTKFGTLSSDAVTAEIRLQTITADVDPALASAKPDDKFQFERHGYFVACGVVHKDGKVALNKITGLKDIWCKS